MKENEMRQIGALIMKVLREINNNAALAEIRKQVGDLTSQFPVP
jgi:glycine/serine hydroxymethyltransferase